MKFFLITAYSIDPDYKAKRNIIEHILSEFGWQLMLAEDEKSKGSLSAEKTIELFNNCDYFIADLSFERPSCYYEIGYLQALHKEIFLISRDSENIHQLINRAQIEFYNDLDEYKKLIEKKVRKLTKAKFHRY